MIDETAYREGTEGRSEVRALDLGRMMAVAAGVTLAVNPDAGAAEPCARLLTPTALPRPWTAALEDLARQIAALPASDCRPVTLVIAPSREGVRIDVTAFDGGHTSREVLGPDGLVATALGLLLTIPAPLPADPASTTKPTLAATTIPTPTRPPTPTPDDAPVSPRVLAVWAGLATGVRLTAPTGVTVLDVEGRLDVMLGRWMLLPTVRSALVSCLGQQGIDCDVYNDVSFGIGVGRRFFAGTAAVDVAFEPSIVWMHMEYDVPGTGEDESVSGSQVALRLDASARLAVPLGPSWAFTLTIDAGLAPTMLQTTRLELPPNAASDAAPPPFPAWTGGVRVGASGALL
jgi:hypothetical protein